MRIGDSTSIGLMPSAYQPNKENWVDAQYRKVGAGDVKTDISGAGRLSNAGTISRTLKTPVGQNWIAAIRAAGSWRWERTRPPTKPSADRSGRTNASI